MERSDRTLPTNPRTRRIARALRALGAVNEAFLVALAVLIQLFAPETARAMAQRTGDFELEMDAPWRIEPRGGANPYGAIPIQVSIHDADQPATGADMLLQRIISITQGHSEMDALYAYLEGPIDALLGPTDEILSWFGIDIVPQGELPPVLILDRFESLKVEEEIGNQFVLRRTYSLADIHEVERSVGIWKHSAALTGPEVVGTPPARPVHSICRRWQGQDCTSFAPLRTTSEWHMTAFYTPSSATPGRDVRLRTTLTVSATKDGVAGFKTYQRFLTIHLAAEPLPKFGSEWAYGDLHYHSQGTDNDGESGYSYRGTVQAMNAMGLDFTFATDHASNSPQIGSAEPQFSNELVRPIFRGLRDMSPDRFAFGIDVLNGPTGANRQVVSFARPSGSGTGAAAAQLFLGAEVDVTPETKPGDVSSAHFCFYVPKFLKALDQHSIWPDEFKSCPDSMSVPTGDGRELMLDVQGPNAGRLLSTDFFARQHMIHLPVDPQRKTSFIASNTSKYGGGTRRLREILDVELDQRQKGYAFLAHPFAEERGDGVDALGPNLISYTRAQLDDAFDSPYILGLQIWSENPVASAKANDIEPFPSPAWTGQEQPFHFLDFQKWDLLQLRGLDTKRTASLSWLHPGEPRRIFAAGGSDAHGDLNYRRKGFFLGTKAATDTAIGKPRNLVFVGPAAGTPLSSSLGSATPLSQKQVVDGLRSGNFSITDGPAVRVVIDANKNGVIDATDIPMGGIHRHTITGPFNVIVEWKSTAEFAPVEKIDLLLGVWAEEVPEGMVYTPNDGGPHVDPDYNYRHPNGTIYSASPNIPYWFDPNAGNPLSINLQGRGNAGQAIVTIDPAKYPVGQPMCEQTPTVVRSATTTTTGTIAGTATVSAPTTAAKAGTATTTGGTTTTTTGTAVPLQQSLDKTLEDLINGTFEPFPPCPNRVFKNPTTPDRMFIRAEVRNQKAPDISTICQDPKTYALFSCGIRRTAYTNPVWVKVETCTTGSACSNETAGDPGGGVIDGGGSGGSGGLTVNPTVAGQLAGTATTATGGSGTTTTSGGVIGTTTGTLTTATVTTTSTTTATPTTGLTATLKTSSTSTTLAR
jgi:hypothetical protein